MQLIVAVDLSDATDRVIAAAAAVARHTGAHVYLVHVVPGDPAFVGYEAGPDTVRQQVAQEIRSEHRALQAHAETLRGQGIEATALLAQGYPVEILLREAERLDAALIVTGSHGRSAVYDIVIGSVSEDLIRRTTRPVLVVPIRPVPRA
jgi:nucleotide-binding universal stress UspA family protein